MVSTVSSVITQAKQTSSNIYFNRVFDKGRLKALINWSLIYFGEKKTIDLIEIFKNLGYAYSTKAGISLGIDGATRINELVYN